ncbi:hypothetical protein ROZALSC1DRAFT_29462, partial [Rozella allomycis CSF55]
MSMMDLSLHGITLKTFVGALLNDAVADSIPDILDNVFRLDQFNLMFATSDFYVGDKLYKMGTLIYANVTLFSVQTITQFELTPDRLYSKIEVGPIDIFGLKILRSKGSKFGPIFELDISRNSEKFPGLKFAGYGDLAFISASLDVQLCEKYFRLNGHGQLFNIVEAKFVVEAYPSSILFANFLSLRKRSIEDSERNKIEGAKKSAEEGRTLGNSFLENVKKRKLSNMKFENKLFADIQEKYNAVQKRMENIKGSDQATKEAIVKDALRIAKDINKIVGIDNKIDLVYKKGKSSDKDKDKKRSVDKKTITEQLKESIAKTDGKLASNEQIVAATDESVTTSEQPAVHETDNIKQNKTLEIFQKALNDSFKKVIGAAEALSDNVSSIVDLKDIATRLYEFTINNPNIPNIPNVHMNGLNRMFDNRIVEKMKAVIHSSVAGVTRSRNSEAQENTVNPVPMWDEGTADGNPRDRVENSVNVQESSFARTMLHAAINVYFLYYVVGCSIRYVSQGLTIDEARQAEGLGQYVLTEGIVPLLISGLNFHPRNSKIKKLLVYTIITLILFGLSMSPATPKSH